MGWVSEHPALAWLAVALVLGAIEVATLDFFFIMLAIGALGACLVAGLGGPVVLQVVAFVVVALLLLGVLRPFLTRRLHGGEATLTGAAALVGKQARVLETVSPTGGRIKLHGEVWSARTQGQDVAEAVLPGHTVRVVAIEGATAVVTQDVETHEPVTQDPEAP